MPLLSVPQVHVTQKRTHHCFRYLLLYRSRWAHFSQSFHINSKRHRPGSVEVCCQWELLTVQITTLLLFTVVLNIFYSKEIYILYQWTIRSFRTLNVKQVELIDDTHNCLLLRGVLRMQKLRTPRMGAKGYLRFPLFKPGVGI